MARFLTQLKITLLDNDKIWILDAPLIYESDLVGRIEVPVDFQTDFASVPRLPIIYSLFGDRAHREAVIHDYIFRIDSIPIVSFEISNKVFLEAMTVRNKPVYIRYPMYYGVCLGAKNAYHKRYVKDNL